MKRTLRHPIRGDRLHPKPSTRTAAESAWRSEAAANRGMRPRKSVNVASLVGSPEDEPSRPNLRLRVVGIVVLVLFLVLVLRLWTLQIIDGKSYAAAVTRNQVRVVSVAAPRGEIVDRNDTRAGHQRARAGDPALAGQRHRATPPSSARWPP